MKRIGIALLIVAMILTGCKKQEDPIREPESQGVSLKVTPTVTPTDKVEETIESFQLKLNPQWSMVKTAELKKEDYVEIKVKGQVKPYHVESDLSNIKNLNQFQGFTKEQMSMLAQNGFVVVPTTNSRIYYTYDSNEYLGIPNFITTDAMIHTYHQLYNKTLTAIEENYLSKDLEELTKRMLSQSIELYNNLEEDSVKELQKDNITFFLVARMLMLDSKELSTEGTLPVGMEGAYELAAKEYQVATMAEDSMESQLLKKPIDYTQFKPRGHYTKSETLERFFRTMMWFSYGSYDLVMDNEFQYENTLKALLMSFTTMMDQGEGSVASLWMNIYQPTSHYVGVSDDINVFDINELRTMVYDQGDNPNSYGDEKYYQKLEEATKKLPAPQIMNQEDKNSINRQFRYMGQRYVLDSDILQNLMDNSRTVPPTALEVMDVLGSDLARDYVAKEYNPQKNWEAYEQNRQDMVDKVGAYDSSLWTSNLYNGWLWSIKELLPSKAKDSGYPMFMTNDAWSYKSLNTALGSYTELKHDTVLYGKQATAQGGGIIEYAKYHYVEPNIELYNKLKYLTSHTISILEEKEMLDENVRTGAKKFETLLELLIEASKKELNNEVLTEEEYKELLKFGAELDWIHYCFNGEIIDGVEPKPVLDLVVTDIANWRGSPLTLATGFFDDIYVVIAVGDELYLSRGSVYSHYEFLSEERLSNEQWWEMNGVVIRNEEYAQYPEYTGETDNLPEQAAWVKKFKVGQNDIVITPLEVIWERLQEE